MSLILKGVDLPKDADKVIIIIANKNNQKVYSIPSPQTDIIQIPKGHGSIADARTIAEAIKKSPLFASKYKETAALYIEIYGRREAILKEEE